MMRPMTGDEVTIETGIKTNLGQHLDRDEFHRPSEAFVDRGQCKDRYLESTASRGCGNFRASSLNLIATGGKQLQAELPLWGQTLPNPLAPMNGGLGGGR